MRSKLLFFIENYATKILIFHAVYNAFLKITIILRQHSYQQYFLIFLKAFVFFIIILPEVFIFLLPIFMESTDGCLNKRKKKQNMSICSYVFVHTFVAIWRTYCCKIVPCLFFSKNYVATKQISRASNECICKWWWLARRNKHLTVIQGVFT